MKEQTIGVLGGGQLGRMMVQAAVRLGIPIITLDKENSPASQVSNPQAIDSEHRLEFNHQIGNFNHMQDIKKLAQLVDILTIEIEHVNVPILKSILEDQNSGSSSNGHKVKIFPHPEVIEIIQDKFKQKTFLNHAKIPVADFEEIPQSKSIDQLEQHIQCVGKRLGFPLMLKTRLLAYDGRGNFLIKTPQDIRNAIRALAPLSANSNDSDLFDLKLYAERFVPFICEIAVMVVKGTPDASDSNFRTYPPVQTIHEDNICQVVHSPLRLGGPTTSNSAISVAQQAINALGPGAVGVFAVEMFLLSNNTVLVNEIAPRPHNSYHHTISSTPVSQFTAHLLAITSKPLPPIESFELSVPSAAMVNILGDQSGEIGEQRVKRCVEMVTGLKGISVELYGKFGCQKGRKMGHINIVGESDADVRDIVSKVSKCLPVNQDIPTSLTIPLNAGFSHPNPLVSIIMGSDSDLPTMIEASRILSHPLFRIAHELTIVSAHRTPDRMSEFAKNADSRGVKVIIAGAGGAAHLPGMVAAITPLPVIGVPVKGKILDGVDSLHSIVQMPRGIPVATVAIGNSTNAALLAVRILSVGIPRLTTAMRTYMDQMETEVMKKVEKLSQVGWESYS